MAIDNKTLVQSGPITRDWLRILRTSLTEFNYREAKYWASFRTKNDGKAVAQLGPLKNHIRLFLSLDQDAASDLNPTPSSSSWAKRLPTVFKIAREDDVPRAAELIIQSAARIELRGHDRIGKRRETTAAEELPSDVNYFEGSTKTIKVNAYERNQRARKKCIEHYGATCVVCGFDFTERYGPSAAGYIHIHHVVPISSIRKSYRLDPVADLRPVCPNCHAVIHRREPPYSIDEVQEMIRNPQR